MKKFVLALTVLFCVVSSIAQNTPVWFDIAATGSGGACILTSKNLFRDTKTVKSGPAFCYAFGGKFGINFNECHELAFNAEYFNRAQNYDINMDSIKFNKKIALKGIDLALLYRFRGKESSGYVEIDPQMSLVSGIEESREGLEKEVSEMFQKNYYSAVFGFGSNIIVANAFTWTGGFRFTHSLTDLISNDGGRGKQIAYPLNDPGSSKQFNSYSAFTSSTLVLHTEFTFDLGYFAKAKCKRGRISFLRFK